MYSPIHAEGIRTLRLTYHTMGNLIADPRVNRQSMDNQRRSTAKMAGIKLNMVR